MNSDVLFFVFSFQTPTHLLILKSIPIDLGKIKPKGNFRYKDILRHLKSSVIHSEFLWTVYGKQIK